MGKNESPAKDAKGKEVGDIVPLTFPKIKAVDGVSMYLLSKLYQKEPKLEPRWDLARDCIGLGLGEAIRHLKRAEKRLYDIRQLSIKKRQVFNEQYRDLAEKESNFQISFQKFNKFVRENHEKRERADKKIVEERLLQQKRDEEIASIKENIANLTSIKVLMDQKNKEYRMYEDYLQNVVRLSPQFKNINDLIVRYEALVEAKILLGERQDRQFAYLEHARADLARLLEEKQLILIGLCNHLLEMQDRYKDAKSNTLLWETLVSQIQDVTIHKIQDVQAVKTTCWDTYTNMCGRKGIPRKCAKEDLEAQLIFIKKTLNELKTAHLAMSK